MSGATAIKPTAADLDLCEAITTTAPAGSLMGDDGTVDICIIRPGIGKGRGRHYYSPDMLRENAEVFNGWKVYVDHLSAEAKKAAGGLPRSMNDLGGMIMEARWDDSVPANGSFERGAVMGKLKPIRTLRETIEELPEAVEFSIKAKATGVEQEIMEGQPTWVVEGIKGQPAGSVDAVTEAGAGGRIANLLESLDESAMLQEAADLDHDTFYTPSRQYPVGTEGDALDSLIAARATGDPRETDLVEAAVHARFPTLAKPRRGTDEGDEVATLEEALRDPDSAVSQAIEARATSKVEDLIEGKVEEALEQGRKEGRDAVLEEAKAGEIKRDLHEEAERRIEEAKLPKASTEKLKGRYGLEESTLDLEDEVEDGEVKKSAMAQLRESVDKEIEEQRALVSELRPTKVRGQGAGELEEGAEPATAKDDTVPYWQEVLQESGFEKPEDLYEVQS